MQLALDDQRIDHGAEVVHASVSYDLDHAGIGVELDLADVAAIGEGGRSGPVAHMANVERRRSALRQIDPGAQLLRELHDRDRSVGAGDDKTTLPELDVADRPIDRDHGARAEAALRD